MLVALPLGWLQPAPPQPLWPIFNSLSHPVGKAAAVLGSEELGSCWGSGPRSLTLAVLEEWFPMLLAPAVALGPGLGLAAEQRVSGPHGTCEGLGGQTSVQAPPQCT